jgi:hypothetical protein
MSAILRSANPLGKKVQSNYMAGIRFGGGGGGRPGGKPAFNWKEKKALGIAVVKANAPRKKYFPRGVHLRGDFSTIEHLVKDLPEEDVVNLNPTDPNTNKAVQAMLERLEAERQTRQTTPTLNVAALFGPQKSVGALPRKLNKKVEFSHNRIFGNQ